MSGWPSAADRLTDAQQALLEQRMRGRSGRASLLTPMVAAGPAASSGPLAVTQEQLWFLERLAPDQGVYNETVSIHIDGPLNIDALRSAFAELPARHDAWRSFFTLVEGRPTQHIAPFVALGLPLVDLSGLAERRAEEELIRLAAEQAQPRYDLAEAPLLRACLVALAPERHQILLALHHLTFDGTTLAQVVLPDLVALYEARRSGAPFPPMTAGSFLEFARWQQSWIQGPVAGRRLEYWQRQLSGSERLDLPLDRPRAPVQGFAAARLPVEMPPDVVADLRALGREHDATLFHVLAAAFAIMLGQECAQEDIVFGTVTDTRAQGGFEKVAGYAVTTLVLRCGLEGDPSLSDVLRRTSNLVLDALDNAVPFDRVVRTLNLPRDASTNPIVQAMLVMQPPTPPAAPGWALEQLGIGSPEQTRAKFDLHLELDEREDGTLRGRLTINADVFELTTAQRMLDTLTGVLSRMLAEPESRLSELARPAAVSVPAPRAWKGPVVDLYDRFQAVVASTPTVTALTWRGQDVTFGDLDARARILAGALRVTGITPGDVVGLCLHRSPDLVAAMLAIARLGATSLPLDPEFPQSRLAFMLGDAEARTVITHSELEHLVRPADTVLVDVPIQGSAAPDTFSRASAAVCGDLLYVLYTSGSTGTPKGVAVRRSAVSALLEAFAQEPGLLAGQSVLAHTTVAFDISVLELWFPLAYGARIVLADRDQARDGSALVALLERESVDVVQATPAMWQLLLAAGWQGSPLLVAITGGERLPPELASELLARVGELWNCYGPTETTVYSTAGRVTKAADISIGIPIPGTRVYVVDDRQALVSPGVRGELLIGGAGVMAGYLNRPDLTAERIVSDPVIIGEVAYRTGDIVRQAADGTLRHLGRVDEQIKLRGFRIEPGEIESALLSDPAVSAAVVIRREDRPGDPRLVGYVVLVDGGPAPEAISARLSQLLPAYLLPSALVSLPSIPRTANGKVDRASLPAPVTPDGLLGEPPAAGLETQIAEIWCEVLGLSRIGRHDDFFALGGHSLLAALLAERLERATGRQFALVNLLRGGSTVAGMARLMQLPTVDGLPVEPEDAVPGAETGQRLHLLYPSSESMLSLRHLVPLLPLPTHALVLPLVNGRFDLEGSVEELAGDVLRRIRHAQPSGPYLLAGYSFAGLVAYELARALRDAGEEVQWLGLLDTLTPSEVRWLQNLTLRQRAVRLRETGLWPSVRNLRMRRRWLPAPVGAFDWHGVDVLASRYAGRPHDISMDLFSPTTATSYGGHTVQADWRDQHAGELCVHDVPGDHSTMLTQPHVGELGRAMASSLAAVIPRLQQAVPVAAQS